MAQNQTEIQYRGTQKIKTETSNIRSNLLKNHH